MILTAIAAMADNRVIGRNNDLIWHMPEDLKHFKSLTSGHHVIMGRKTYESMGRPLPKRVNIVVTRQSGYEAPGCLVVPTIKDAIQKAENDEQPFIVGGGEIYRQSLPFLKKMELTIIHHEFEGDTHFPEYDPSEWEITRQDFHKKDEKNPYDYSFLTLERKED